MGDLLDSVEQHTGEHRMLLMQLFSNPIKVPFGSAFFSQTSHGNLWGILAFISFGKVYLFIIFCIYVLPSNILSSIRNC